MTVRAGVIGWPIGQSRSPVLHGHWLQRHGIDGSYEAIPVAPDRLRDEVLALRDRGYAGLNVTIPHKEHVAGLLDRADAVVERTGSTNLLVFHADGSIEGRSTDGTGFIENLRHGAPDWRPAHGPALVLGAGGAGVAVVDALLATGTDVVLTNRTRARAEDVAAALGSRVQVIDWDQREAALGDAALLVNATSLGMVGKDPLPFDLARLRPDAVVTDLVYVPLETALLAGARRRGATVVDGLGMLLHQAVPAFAAWFGVTPTVDLPLREAVLATMRPA